METQKELALKKLNDVIVEFSKDSDIIDTVKRIESKPETTQNHYGDYMAFLTPFAGDPISFRVMSGALAMAGGNVLGIHSAIRIIKG